MLANSDARALSIPVGGQIEYRLAIPNSQVFAGLPLSHQLLQIELDASGNLMSLSGSNALALVIGSF